MVNQSGSQSAGKPNSDLDKVAHLYATGQIHGTPNLANGRRGAISGPSGNYSNDALGTWTHNNSHNHGNENGPSGGARPLHTFCLPSTLKPTNSAKNGDWTAILREVMAKYDWANYCHHFEDGYDLVG